MNYDGFLHGKVVTAPESGMDVKPEELSRKLKPHQRDAVIWALKGGRRGLFESFGLGKTASILAFAAACLGLVVLALRSGKPKDE